MDVAIYSSVREIDLHDFKLKGKGLEGSFRAAFDGHECPHELLLLENPKKRLLAIIPSEPYHHTELRDLVEIPPEAHDALQRAIDALLPARRKEVVSPDFRYRIAVGRAPLLGCPGCQKRFSLHQLLTHSHKAWPNQKRILFTCPECHKESNLQFSGHAVSIGELDGGPGPCFLPPKQWTARVSPST